MMSDYWYEVIDASQRLTQGDLIFECPVVTWDVSVRPKGAASDESDRLRQAVTALSVDVDVMTQACDLEHDKVQNVVLCPHAALSDFRAAWEEDVRGKQQNPTQKARRRLCAQACSISHVAVMSSVDCHLRSHQLSVTSRPRYSRTSPQALDAWLADSRSLIDQSQRPIGHAVNPDSLNVSDPRRQMGGRRLPRRQADRR